MDASAYFSSGPPPTQQQQSGYPPRVPNQQQQYGNNVQQGEQQQYQVATTNSYGQQTTIQRSYSNDSTDQQQQFETLDLNTNTTVQQSASMYNNNNYGTNTPLTANSSGNSNFGRPSVDNSYSNMSSSGSYAVASSGPENFSMPQPQQQHATQYGQAQQMNSQYNNTQDETFFANVASNVVGDVRHVVGSVGNVTSSVASGVMGGVRNVTSSYVTPSKLGGNVAGSVGNVASAVAGGLGRTVAPSNIATNMANWRGRIAEVVAPVDNNNAQQGQQFGEKGRAQPPVNVLRQSSSFGEETRQTAADVFGAPSPAPSPKVSPMLTSVVATPSTFATVQGQPVGEGGFTSHQQPAQQQQQQEEVNSAQELFGRPPTPTTMANINQNPVPTSGNSWQMVQQQQQQQQNDGGANNSNASDFFGGSQSTAHQPVATANSLGGSIGGGSSVGGGEVKSANDYFNAPSPMVQQQPLPVEQPSPMALNNESSAGDFFNAPSMAPQQQPQQQVAQQVVQEAVVEPPPKEEEVQPKRQFSHRLSSMEKSIHDPTSFQYDDPLEGSATIVPGRSNTDNTAENNNEVMLSSDSRARNSIAESTPRDADEDKVEEKDRNNAITAATGSSVINVAAGSSSTALNEMTSGPPATGGLTAMEVGKYITPSVSQVAAALSGQDNEGQSVVAQTNTTVEQTGATTDAPMTAMEMFQGSSSSSNTAQQPQMSTITQPIVVSQPSTPSAILAASTSMNISSTTKATPASIPTPRRLHLPIPKKANLPLPPPLPTRKKPSGGSSNGGEGGKVATPFRKPPPMEINAASPRFNVPGPIKVTSSPRVSPMPSPRVIDPKKTMPRFPSPSPRIVDDELSQQQPDDNATCKEESVVEASQPSVEEVSPPSTVDNEPCIIPSPVVHSEPPSAQQTTVLPPQQSSDNDDWSMVANSVVKNAVNDAVNNIVSSTTHPDMPPPAPRPSLQQQQEEQPSPDKNMRPEGTYSATAPPIYPNNQIPETPSSRVTECDVMSDYQSNVREEDVPTDVPFTYTASFQENNNSNEDQPLTTETTIETHVPTSSINNNQDDEMIQSSLDPSQVEVKTTISDGGSPESGVLVEGEQDAVESTSSSKNDDDVPYTSEVDESVAGDNPAADTIPASIQPESKEDALPEGWVEATDPTTGKVYYYNEISSESSWERPCAIVQDQEDVNGPSSPNMSVDQPNVDEVQHPTEVDVNADDQPVNVEEEVNNEQPNTIIEDEANVANEEPSVVGESSNDALPEAWVETIDQSSGKVYYYNQTTGESAWERPCNVVADEQVVDEPTVETEVATSSAIEEESNVVDEVQPAVDPQLDEVEENEQENTVDMLPEGWIELTDEGSGKVYYFNELTGVTQWDRPEPAVLSEDVVTEEEKEPASTKANTVDNEGSPFPKDEEEEDDDEKSTYTEQSASVHSSANLSFESLPSGWIEASDPTTGKVYYYNEETGASSWDKPLLKEVDVIESHAAKEDHLEPSEKTDKQPPKRQLSHRLSSMEKSIHDPTSFQYDDPLEGNATIVLGRNTTDKIEDVTLTSDSRARNSIAEVSENIVESSVATAIEETIDGVGTEESQVEEDTTTPSDDLQSIIQSLHSGWIEATDPSSGNTYYYNEETGASSWTKPESEDIAGIIDVPTESAEMESTAEVDAIVEPTESVEEDNVAVQETEAVAVESIVEGNTKEEDDPDAVPESEDLWIEATDPASGNVYYYNSKTGMTSWTKPEDQVDDDEKEAPEDISNEVIKEEEVSAGEVLAEKKSESEELDEWTQVEHPASGNVEGVEMAGSEEVEGPNDTQLPHNQLPEGWQEMTDPASGNVYYYNEETGESSWENPSSTQQDPHAEPEKVASNVANVAEENEQDVAIKEEEEPKSTSMDEMNAVSSASIQSDDVMDDEDVLPKGWAEATDPNSGQVYYYHEESGATSWERPAKEDDVVDDQQPPADVSNEELTTAQVDETKADEIKTEPSMIEEESSRPTSGKDDTTPQLPNGWSEAIDPGTGNVYYYHEDSGQTSWERPTTTEDEDIPEEDGINITRTDSNNAAEELQAEESSTMPETADVMLSPLPDGWEEVIDPGSGKAYYYNETSGETTWDRPAPTKEQLMGSNSREESSTSHITDGAATATTTVEHRPRPAHAIATFGFGGRLCVMIPQVAATLSGATPVGDKPLLRRGPVVIHRLCSLVPQEHEHSIPSSDAPLLKTEEDKVMSNLKEKSSNPDNLLWNIIQIAALNRGRLRNDKKVKKAIIEVLLASSTENTNDQKKKDKDNMPPSPFPTSDLSEVQDLILRGDRESAVSEALTQKNYALALLIASMCDRTTYQIASRRFADEVLECGSPLHTATLLFSNNLEVPRDEELLNPSNGHSFWNEHDYYGDLEKTWREQLASIMSNQTTGWERIVLALGDRLLQLGQCQAAHVCYLVSYSTFGSPSNESTRLVLLGCDHRIYMNRMLMTPQSIQSFERSEAFEWARRRGNRKTSIPSLQPFKLRYAELLADFGYEDLAREYLLSIRSCIGLDLDKRKGGKASATAASGNTVHDLKFIESLKRLDDRICGSTGAEPSSWDNKDDRRGSLAAVGSIVKSVLGKKPKAEEVPPLSKTTDKPKSIEKSQMAEVEDESPREVAQLSMPPQQSIPTSLNPQSTNEVLDTTLEGDESFMTTKTSFEKTAADAPEEVQQEDRPKSPTTLLSNPFSHKMGKPNDEQQQQQDAPSSAPPMFSLDQEPKPKEEIKKKETILSTPVSKKKDDKEKAPVSEPPRSTGWLSKLLRKKLDPDSKATVADVGEEMQAYYDEKLKRWIFPGDDPAEVAKPLAPPPIIPKTSDAAPSTPAPAATPASNDPLAALMAPPPSGVLSKKRGTPTMSRYGGAPPLSSIGNVTPSTTGGKKPPASPMMKPPTFATFQPKPATSQTTDSSKEEDTS